MPPAIDGELKHFNKLLQWSNYSNYYIIALGHTIMKYAGNANTVRISIHLAAIYLFLVMFYL